VKGQILKALRRGEDYVSGEALSKELGISRVSVWKHIQGLKEDGYIIEASAKGYRLVSSPDLLLPYEFPGQERKLHHFRQVGSTMDVARELAKKGAEAGSIVVAESQSQGRGRMKREWLSPQGGIYFTVILRPEISPIYAPRINLMASVAVAKTIRRLFGLNAELKWPNDVLIQGRKVGGILAEMDAEMDVINFVNLGVGINVNSSIHQFEATSLKDEVGKEISRKDFFASVITEILRYAQKQALLTEADLLEEWKNLSVTLNREVRIVSLGEVILGQAIDIDATGALIVKSKDGSLRTVLAGDCFHVRSQTSK
jgi:BirA family biotin operon repressor/biotin-[acetyl-CoA-carboxylase] ligase